MLQSLSEGKHHHAENVECITKQFGNPQDEQFKVPDDILIDSSIQTFQVIWGNVIFYFECEHGFHLPDDLHSIYFHSIIISAPFSTLRVTVCSDLCLRVNIIMSKMWNISPSDLDIQKLKAFKYPVMSQLTWASKLFRSSELTWFSISSVRMDFSSGWFTLCLFSLH